VEPALLLKSTEDTAFLRTLLFAGSIALASLAVVGICVLVVFLVRRKRRRDGYSPIPDRDSLIETLNGTKKYGIFRNNFNFPKEVLQIYSKSAEKRLKWARELAKEVMVTSLKLIGEEY
jgi:hypothetical protein